MKKPLFILAFLSSLFAGAQYWQQRVDYTMDINMHEDSNRFTGRQLLRYTNNSPYTLQKVYYHLYFNAFQPNSEMDVRSRTIADPDKRVGSRIYHLKEDEQGYHRILSVKQDGKPVSHQVSGTILEVWLQEPLAPGKQTSLLMEFESQVPLQVRRSGRDNVEGIRFSMTQWYPKLCEFDKDGWHTDPYIGREFHGVWGDFKVNITMDSSYLIGGTGVLTNANEIGKGYEKPGSKVKRKSGNRLTWEFSAKNVHDFAWAADPDFVHLSREAADGVVLHMIYQPDSVTAEVWPQLGDFMAQALDIMNAEFGKYPYPQYTFIQGGDGGMEYPMVTLITGRRNLGSLVGVSVHEMNHSWYQGVLGFDESRYYWMDEGFTEYSGDVVMSRLFPAYAKGAFHGAYTGYFSVAGKGNEQPLSTHADWFNENKVYGIAAYNKGSVFLSQLRHIVGDSVFRISMLDFYEQWKFRHPEATDLKIVFELRSGMELDWYFEQWIGTTHTIDYGIEMVAQKNGTLHISLERIGEIPMPLDLMITMKDGTRKRIYIPVSLMHGKRTFADSIPTTVLEPWRWVDTHYSLILQLDGDCSEILIDPGNWLADVNRENNAIILPH